MNTHKEPARSIPVPFRSMYETESEYRIAKETYNKNMELRWKESTPPSQIEEETIYRLIMLWHDYNKHSYTGGTVRSEVTFEEFIQSSWLLEAINKLTKE